MNEVIIKNEVDTMFVLDSIFKDERDRWNNFFDTLKEDHPLSSTFPDESLVEYLNNSKLTIGKAIDIGCGNGRNSVYLAQKGFEVDAIDISDSAIDKTLNLAKSLNVTVNAKRVSFFDYNIETKYDLVYDTGLLHHVFPHRRPVYLDRVCNMLSNNGYLAIIAFNEKMGTKVSDLEIYQQQKMEGGISYPLEKLKLIFEGRFEFVEYRPLKNCKKEDQIFGHDFASASLWKRLSSNTLHCRR